VPLATANGNLEWIVPVLGMLVGILGAVKATRDGPAAWATIYLTLAVLVPVLLVLAFVVLILTAFSYNHTAQAIGAVVAVIGLLFPLVVFVTAQVYTARNRVPPGKAGA
jgi:hypothetical protein